MSRTSWRRAARDRALAWLFVAAILVVVALVVAKAGFLTSKAPTTGASGVAAGTGSSQTPTPTPTPRRHRSPAAASTATTSSAPAGDPFEGATVGIDPGHNGGNFTHTAEISRQIWNGREHEDCNTTGTATDAGYTEARFNYNVAMYLEADLRKAGANVVLTRHSNTGVGPCVNQRAEIINASHAAVAIAIHADGGPASGRGFAVLEPVRDGINNKVIAASRAYGTDLRNAFEKTGMPTSTYDGVDGIDYRNNLAGLNLTTVPQALIECGNMRNATDAGLLTSALFQRKAAQAIMAGMAAFLTGASG